MRDYTQEHVLKKSTLKRKQKNRLSGAISLIVLSTYSAALLAQGGVTELAPATVDSDADEGYRIDRAQSFKYSQPMIETPKSLTIISSEAMRDRGVTNLRDALRSVPGISMAAGEGGTPSGDSMTIRGFNASTDIFADGIRDIAGYSRDTYNTEGIEVAKGPGSSVSGRGSVGGSINLAKKTARNYDFVDVALTLGAESNKRLTIDGNQQVGVSSAVRVNILSTEGGVAGRDFVTNSMNAISVNFTAGLDTASRFSFTGEYQNQDNISDFGLPWVPDDVPGYESYAGGPPPTSLFDNFYGNVNRDKERVKATSFTALYEYDLSASSTLRVQARRATVDRDSVVTSPRFNGGRGAPVSAQVRLNDVKPRDQSNEMTAFQLAYIANFNVGSMVHDFSMGIDYYDESDVLYRPTTENDNLLTVLNNLSNPHAAHLSYTGFYSSGAKPSADGNSITKAIYIFDTIELNEQWEINAGLRAENYENKTSSTGFGGPFNGGRDDNMVSWNIAAVYKLHNDATVYFGVGKSFNPSAEDLTGGSNESGIGPEESIGYEVGTKWNVFDDRLLASAAIFRTVKENARTSTGFFDPQTLDGEQKITGIEFSAVGQINDFLSVSAAFTHQKSEIVKAASPDAIGLPLARTPENSMSLWLNYTLSPKWDVGFGAEYQDERESSATTRSRNAPSYKVLDLMVSWQATQQLSFQMNADNLTDERFVDLLGGGHFVPGPGRYISLSGRYSF